MIGNLTSAKHLSADCPRQSFAKIPSYVKSISIAQQHTLTLILFNKKDLQVGW